MGLDILIDSQGREIFSYHAIEKPAITPSVDNPAVENNKSANEHETRQ